MCIPEELLTLLDSSHGGVLESDLYPPDSFEYLMSSRERRSKLYEKGKLSFNLIILSILDKYV